MAPSIRVQLLLNLYLKYDQRCGQGSIRWEQPPTTGLGVWVHDGRILWHAITTSAEEPEP